MTPKILAAIILMMFLAACAPTPAPTPVPTSTSTPFPRRSSYNQNVEAMNAAQAALNQMEFGFAPLLVENETRVVIETTSDGPAAKLAYPLQPVDPAAWPAGDSFIFAYTARAILLNLSQIERVALGNFELAAPVANLGDTVNHFAVWVTFGDHTQAVVDLSPLSTDFAAQHKAQKFLSDATELEKQFTAWREGVSLKDLQPMKVLEREGETYYVLAQILIFPDRYEFSLRAHAVQVADPMQPLRLVQGSMVSVKLDRADFETIQKQLAAAGPGTFSEEPELLIRQGSDNQVLNDILDENLDLLWHLVTKLEHKPPQPGELRAATPTHTPTATPTPTPTPTPKRAVPLLTS